MCLTLLPQASQAAYQTVSQFGDNPGQLSAELYRPDTANQTLVVLLHGCAQQGKDLARQSGLLQLATDKHFSLLVPQQNGKNNIKACFNWFSSQDTAKNSGESLSLYNLINQVKTNHDIDTINIVGLSAGGAMVSVMLANYPELFAAGAIIAGLPYGCANDLIKAIACMKSGPKDSVSALTQLMRNNHDKTVRWPKISIWQGTKDAIVNPNNALFMAQQWVALNADAQQKSVIKNANHKTIQWKNDKGETTVQLVQLDQLGHGMPVKPNDSGTGGTLAPFVLQSPLAAGITLVDVWGL